VTCQYTLLPYYLDTIRVSQDFSSCRKLRDIAVALPVAEITTSALRIGMLISQVLMAFDFADEFELSKRLELK
jgi:hypothetical protein